MPAGRESNVTLSADLSERIREKVRSGQYSSENDLVAESLAALEERDANIETWLLDEVLPVYDAWRADPSRAAPVEDAFARLDARIAAEQSKAGRA